MNAYKTFSFTLVFILYSFNILTAQNNGWSSPLPIDTARLFYNPLIAISPKGEIAMLGRSGQISGSSYYSLPLYISQDNGKSFQRKYEFEPPVDYYKIYSPNGLAYDSNSVLWVWWSWSECDNIDCDFYFQRKFYLSRSTDNGYTFDHVLQFDAGINMQNSGAANPVMFIEKDNTIHFIRDSLWYQGVYTRTIFIYNKIPQGDFTKRIEVNLPIVQDSLEVNSILFKVTSDENPFCLINAYGNSNSYYFCTKFQSNGEFSQFQLLDSLQTGLVGKINLNCFEYNRFYLTYWLIRYEPEEKFYYYIMESENGGDTLSLPKLTNEETFNINYYNNNYYYSINYFSKNNKIMYYQFNNLYATPIDSAILGSFALASVTSFINDKNEKYAVLTSQNKSYFLGKDIVTSVINGNNNENKFNLIKLSVNPNPFNNTAIISFTLPAAESIDIAFYDVIGRKVKEINNYTANKGSNKVSFETSELPSGVYLLTLLYNNTTYTVKTLLLK